MIKHIPSVSIIQYVGLYVFSLPITVVMIEIIYILCLIIIIKSEVWTITHCLGLGHETMVSAVYLSIFLWKEFIQNCRRYRANTTCGRDGQTDGRSKTNIYPQQLRCAVCSRSSQFLFLSYNRCPTSNCHFISWSIWFWFITEVTCRL